MKESQHTEWKESWRDEHLRWVCGFANAEGGVLVIGRNDNGNQRTPALSLLLASLRNREAAFCRFSSATDQRSATA